MLIIRAEKSLRKSKKRFLSRTSCPWSLNWALNSFSITEKRFAKSAAHIYSYISTYPSLFFLPCGTDRHLFLYFLIGFCVVETRKYFSSKSCDFFKKYFQPCSSVTFPLQWVHTFLLISPWCLFFFKVFLNKSKVHLLGPSELCVCVSSFQC